MTGVLTQNSCIDYGPLQVQETILEIHRLIGVLRCIARERDSREDPGHSRVCFLSFFLPLSICSTSPQSQRGHPVACRRSNDKIWSAVAFADSRKEDRQMPIVGLPPGDVYMYTLQGISTDVIAT
jgi:hypothetical protein